LPIDPDGIVDDEMKKTRQANESKNACLKRIKVIGSRLCELEVQRNFKELSAIPADQGE
jgi:hypothetical protein